LVESLLHGAALPPAVEEPILTRAQGNPFFVEEVVRSLIDAGLLYREGAAWHARAESSAAVPDTVQSVIMSRVDHLNGQVKHVLQSAAVIGRLFSRQLLDEVVRLDEGGASDTRSILDRALGELEDRQLIYQERAIPEVEYSFQHALTQETVYQNMLRRHHTQMHRAVAEALERLYAENLPEYYEQLAYHYDHAGVVEKAVEYQLKAGETAQHAYLREAAPSYFQRALAYLEGTPVGRAHPEWMLSALHGLGIAFRLLEKLPDAEMALRRAIALGRELRQPARALVQLYYMLGDVLFHQNRGVEEVQLGEEGLALLGDDTACTEAALMNHIIAHGHGSQGNLGQAYAYMSRIARLIEALPYSIYWGTFLWSVEAPLAAKDVERALEIVLYAESVAQQHSADAMLAGLVQTQRAQVLFCIGDLHGAVAHLQAALDYHARSDRISELFNCGWLAEKYLALGDLRNVRKYAERVAAEAGRRAERELGTLALCEDAANEATAHLDAALHSPFAGSVDMMSLGRAYVAQGRREGAARHFEEALARATPADTNENAVYSPYVQVLPNALSGLEEASGSGERVRALVERLRQESLHAPLLPLVPCLVPAVVVGPVRPQHVHEEFTIPLSPAWTWHDPFGDCFFGVEEGLRIRAANGRDLWHVNLSAPRLLQPAPAGDYAVQTLCGPALAHQPAIGGLLVWQDREHYLVLERGHWGAADISFRGCLDNEDRYLGRGRLVSDRVWLRLERQGGRVRALCSADSQEWFTAGEIEFPAREGEQVGVHAIGMIDRTIYHGAYAAGTAICFTAFDLSTTAAA
jgi:tetratricopeptide (TPR) repeat protein